MSIDFSQLQEVIKRIKNPALQKKLNTILQAIKEQVDLCNQHYAQDQNSTATQVTDSLTKIQYHLDDLSKLAELGDLSASLIPTPEEKQTIHLVQQTLQRSLPETHPYTLDWLIDIRDKSRIALTPMRELRYQAARRIFKQFLSQELQPFIQSLGEPKKIFMSYAWATPSHASYHRDKVYEGQVEKIADDLERAGCQVFLDRWYDQAGKPLTEFLELMGQADCFVPIGTNLYLHKYTKRAENENTREHVVRAEGQILNYIATYSSDWRSKIKPVLLEATPEETLPFLLRPAIPLELHKADYFESFFRLIKSIYGIDNRDEAFKQLERTFYQRIKPLEQQDVVSLQATIQTHQEQKAQHLSKKRELWAGNISLSHKLWHVPALSLHFTGRTELLKTLHEKLTHSPSTMIAITALKGLGGAGKTQLAIKYVYDHHSAYKNIFWISAGSEEQLLLDYRALAEKAALPIENKTPQEVAVQLKDWFEHKHNTGWLMVYDNVNDFKLVETYKPKHGGAILITSRRSNWVGIQHLEVNVFSQAEARDYFQKITGYSIEAHQKDMDQLAEQLGYLPLALAQASAYIATNQISLQEYLNLYTENRREMLADKTMPFDTAHEPVTITWQITFKAIQTQYPAALSLLESCAYLHADNIPEFLLKALFNEQQPDNANQLKPFIEAIGCLQQYGMLKLITQTGEKAFVMHSLVQDVIFDSLSMERKQNYLQAIVKELQALYPHIANPQLEDYARQRNLLPHLEKNLSRMEEWLAELKKSKLSVDSKTQGLESIAKALQLKLLILIADGYQNLGEALIQKTLLERVLVIKEKYYDPGHLEIAKTLGNLGNVYGELGDALKQKAMQKRALAIQKKHYGLDHPEVAKTLVNLSNAYGSLGNVLKKKTLLERALVIKEKYYDPNHLEMAQILMNLGTAHGALGEFLTQKKLLERALVIKEKHYCLDHPEVAKALVNLGAAYGVLGNTLQSKNSLERALAIQEKHYSVDHPEIAKTLGNLSQAYGTEGNVLAQKTLLKRALHIFEKHYGLDHLDVALTLYNLGTVYEYDDLDEKKTLLERALIIQEKHYGLDHPEVAKTLNALGNVYGDLDDVLKKKTLQKRALAIKEKHYGADHPAIAITLVCLGNAYGDLGNVSKQKALQERALAIQEKHYGPDHPEVATTLTNLGKAYGSGDAQKQKALLERALVIKEKHYGPEHPTVAITLINLTSAYLALQQLSEAKVAAERAHQILLTHPNAGPQHPHTQTAKENLDIVNQKLSEPSFKFTSANTATLDNESSAVLEKQLRNAANQANVELLTQLRRENKALNVNAQDNGQHQRSALHWAVIKEAIPCIKVLLQAGADIYLQDKADKSVLDYACELQDPTVLSLLLTHRYQLPMEGEIDIGKLLRRAAHEGDAEVIQKLLEKWPNKVNEKDQGKTERTALHWAVIKGHWSCVKILLAAGADSSICDKENCSAIDWAKKLNHVAINQLLESIPLTNFFQSYASSNEASSSSSAFALRPGS